MISLWDYYKLEYRDYSTNADIVNAYALALAGQRSKPPIINIDDLLRYEEWVMLYGMNVLYSIPNTDDINGFIFGWEGYNYTVYGIHRKMLSGNFFYTELDSFIKQYCRELSK